MYLVPIIEKVEKTVQPELMFTPDEHYRIGRSVEIPKDYVDSKMTTPEHLRIGENGNIVDVKNGEKGENDFAQPIIQGAVLFFTNNYLCKHNIYSKL